MVLLDISVQKVRMSLCKASTGSVFEKQFGNVVALTFDDMMKYQLSLYLYEARGSSMVEHPIRVQWVV